jgi:hypothetical protein
MEYIKSIAVRQVLGPTLRELEKSFKDLEHSTRHSIISFKVKTAGFDLPIKYYSEADLETVVTCNHCGLVFAIYGVFASCPDCAHLTAMSMFRNSLKAARKRLTVLDKIPLDEKEIRDALLVDTLSAIVATFDGLGKRLQKQFNSLIPDKPRNLFQNLDTLTDVLKKNTSIDLPNLLDTGQFQKVYYLFQVRHIWNHNFGEVGVDFIKKTNCNASILGTIILPTKEEISEFLELVESMGIRLREKIQECV